MANKPQLVDQWGTPLRRAELTREVAAPTIGGVRSPISGYPADGLNPLRLASILREADQGDPVRYLELAETIEERDPHYLGVLATRKRSVSQIDITVEPGDEGAAAEQHAQMVRDWLKRDELTDELFNILDSIGKGYSFTEIVWDTSEGQWLPKRLDWRDPRWFRFARHDLATPLMIGDNGQEERLPAFQFVFARMQAKSGLALRGGLARVAAWGWMFKAFTQRDWAIFTQTYGQPLRVGKYGAGASEDDRNKLFNAVANIAGDCAAIIPESMMIDFVESKNVGSSTDHYESRSDWLDKQISKAVLGQTGTTDMEAGGLGSGKEHREVQEDIERADAKALAAILNQDLIRPWIVLEHGPQKVYPRLVIARPEQEDLAAFSNALAPLVQVGLKVSQAEVRQKFGLKDPVKGEEILSSTPQNPPPPTSTPTDGAETGAESEFKYLLKGQLGNPRPTTAAQAEDGPEAAPAATSEIDDIADRLGEEASGPMQAILEQIEAMISSAGSLPEMREMLLTAFPQIDVGDLTDVIALALVSAQAGGMVEVAEADG